MSNDDARFIQQLFSPKHPKVLSPKKQPFSLDLNWPFFFCLK